MQWMSDQIFHNPSLYDTAFSWDLTQEVQFFKNQIIGRPEQEILVPACGTGRYAFALAKEGHSITALDIHSEMLHFAWTHRFHPRIQYLLGDMTEMSLLENECFDGVFLLNNSLRYILNQEKTRLHFKEVNRVLKNNGCYLVEIGLNDNNSLRGASQSWSLKHGEINVQARWTLADLDSPFAIDLVEISLKTPSGCQYLREMQPQLTWSFQNLCSELEKAGFELTAVFNAFREWIANTSKILRQPGKYYLKFEKRRDL